MTAVGAKTAKLTSNTGSTSQSETSVPLIQILSFEIIFRFFCRLTPESVMTYMEISNRPWYIWNTNNIDIETLTVLISEMEILNPLLHEALPGHKKLCHLIHIVMNRKNEYMIYC